MRILKDRRTETVVRRTIFQRVYTNVRLFKLHVVNVYRIFCTKNFRKRHLHLSLSYKYNFSANFSRIFQRIQPRDIELNKSWDAVQSDVEKYSAVTCSENVDGFGNFVNIEFQMLSASYIMNVESPMDRTKNRFCHRPVYPFKALAISSNLIKELSLAVHSTPVTGESSKLRIYFA